MTKAKIIMALACVVACFYLDVLGFICYLLKEQNYLALIAILASCGIIGTALGKLAPKPNPTH